MIEFWFSQFYSLSFHGKLLLIHSIILILTGFHLLYSLRKDKKYLSLVGFIGAICTIFDFYGYHTLYAIFAMFSVTIGFNIYMLLIKELNIHWVWIQNVSYQEETKFAIGFSMALFFGILYAHDMEDLDPDFLKCMGTSILVAIAAVRFSPIFFLIAFQYLVCGFLHYFQYMPKAEPYYLANISITMNGYMHSIVFNIFPYIENVSNDDSLLLEDDGRKASISSNVTIESVRLGSYPSYRNDDEESSTPFQWRPNDDLADVDDSKPPLEWNSDTVPEPSFIRKRTLQKIMNLWHRHPESSNEI